MVTFNKWHCQYCQLAIVLSMTISNLRPVSQNNKKQQYVLLKLEKLFDSHKYVATYQNRVSLNEITVQYQVLLY